MIVNDEEELSLAFKSLFMVENKVLELLEPE